MNREKLKVKGLVTDVVQKRVLFFSALLLVNVFIFGVYLVQQFLAFFFRINHAALRQVNKKIMKSVYKAEFLKLEDVLSFIRTEIIDDNLLLAGRTDADRRGNRKFFAADYPWLKAVIINSINNSNFPHEEAALGHLIPCYTLD